MLSDDARMPHADDDDLIESCRRESLALLERNLDRWTIFFAVVFFVNTLVLLKIL